METKRSVVLLLGIFLSSTIALFTIYRTFPQLEEHEKVFLKLPRRMDDAKEIGRVLSRYKDQHFCSVLGGVALVYVFLQSFAIPGSVFISVLCGFLFTFPLALFVVCLCSSLGASLCYLLSDLIGKPFLLHYFPEKVHAWSAQITKHRDNLLYYILFLRMTPILPNWFINLASPVIEVPIWTFFIGTFFGVAPPSILFVQAGRTLLKLTSSNPVFTWKSILWVGLCAAASISPAILKNYLKPKIE